MTVQQTENIPFLSCGHINENGQNAISDAVNIRKVIIVTDGDKAAQKAVEKATDNLDLCCISHTAGSPTFLDGEQIIELIKQSKHDPVVVMLDDNGIKGEGKGEHVLAVIAAHRDIDIIGVVAVAANTCGVKGVNADFSINNNGHIVKGPVDKNGQESNQYHNKKLCGDTVDVLQKLKIKNIIGIGDIGKMEDHDLTERGALITTKALREIIKMSSGCCSH